MKNFLKYAIPSAVAAFAALLLAGCQDGRKKEVRKTPAQAEAMADSTEKEDTMKAFYERMRHWKVLLKGASHWEYNR